MGRHMAEAALCSTLCLEAAPAACRSQTLPLCSWMSPPQVRRQTSSQSNARLYEVDSCAGRQKAADGLQRELPGTWCALPQQALSTFRMLMAGSCACRAGCQVCWHSHEGCEEHCAHRPHRGKRCGRFDGSW